GRVPRTLAAALTGRRDELRDVRVLQGATAYPLACATDTPGWDEHIAYVTDYITPLVRPCLDARRGDFALTDYAIGARAGPASRRSTARARRRPRCEAPTPTISTSASTPRSSSRR